MMTEEVIEARIDELKAERVGLEIGLEGQYQQLSDGNVFISKDIYEREQRIEVLKFVVLELEAILRG